MDTELYGNEYPLDEVMSDLTAAIFKADASTEVNAFRRNLQSEYVDHLGAIIEGSGSEGFDSSAKAMAIHELEHLASMMNDRASPDTMTQAHTKLVSRKIRNILEPKLTR